jgi:hypothetical protein
LITDDISAAPKEQDFGALSGSQCELVHIFLAKILGPALPVAPCPCL